MLILFCNFVSHQHINIELHYFQELEELEALLAGGMTVEEALAYLNAKKKEGEEEKKKEMEKKGKKRKNESESESDSDFNPSDEG